MTSVTETAIVVTLQATADADPPPPPPDIPPPGNLLSLAGDSMSVIMMLATESDQIYTKSALESISTSQKKAKEAMEDSLKAQAEAAEQRRKAAAEKKKHAVLNFFKNLGQMIGAAVAVVGLIAATIANPALAPATVTLAVMATFTLMDSISQFAGSCAQLSDPDAKLDTLSGAMNKAFTNAMSGLPKGAQVAVSALFAEASMVMGNSEGFSQSLQTIAKDFGASQKQLDALNIFGQAFIAAQQLVAGIAAAVLSGGVGNLSQNLMKLTRVFEGVAQVIQGVGNIGTGAVGVEIAKNQRDADKADLQADEFSSLADSERERAGHQLDFLQKCLDGSQKFLQSIANAFNASSAACLNAASVA